MRKVTFIITIFLVLCSLPFFAFAEAVYLKNGTVMVGRIVEKNEKYIVLKSGEGEDAITATVFMDDVNRIEGQEEYDRKVSLIPFQLRPKEFLWPEVSASAPLPLSIKEPETERIKNLVKGSLEHAAAQKEEYAAPLEGDGASPEQIPFLPYGRQTPKKKMQFLATGMQLSQAMPSQTQGNGRISGAVMLPKERLAGPLYVYLLRDMGSGKFLSTPKLLFVKVQAEGAPGAAVPYSIENVPSGKYRVFAQWDVAPPEIRLENIGSNQVLTFLGTWGDYTGMTAETILLAEDEEKTGVNLMCATLIEKNKLDFYVGPRHDFQIEDIYYQRTASGINRLVLVIKNRGIKPIDLLVFDVYINDQKISPIPLEFNNIAPGEKREFDISGFYIIYLKMIKDGRIPSGPEKVVKFKFVLPSSKETEFEKTLFIL